MCIFIYHDVQLVIDFIAKRVRTRQLLMTMIGTVLLIIPVMCLYNNTAVHSHQPD